MLCMPIRSVSLRLLLPTSQEKEAHLWVCSAWEEKAKHGEMFLLPSGGGSLQGQAAPPALHCNCCKWGAGTRRCLALPILPAASRHPETLDCILLG